jgi:pimeloyl-ACP methyl ester carboxylesterase
MTDGTLRRDGVALHYETHGSVSERPALLLTHGYAASTLMWAPNVPALAADRRVVAWDLPGHGRSASPDDPAAYSEAAALADMAAVLDACGLARAVLVGMSLGGYLSLAFLARHPERVAALVLVDTGPGFKNDAARDRWNRDAEGRAAALEDDGLDALGSGPEVAVSVHDPAGLARAARGMLTQHDGHVMASLPAIRVPTLVIVGEQDEPFRAAADYMAAKIPDAPSVVIPGAGHAANLDQPEAFNAAVRAFLDRLPSSC